MKRCSIATICAALTLACVAAPAAARTGVTGGVIEINQGAAGVTLGMSRADVIATLGKPFYENHNGYMQYSRTSGDVMFDVYLNASTKQAEMIGISGKAFTMADGNAIFTKGGLRRLVAANPGKVKFRRTEDGEPLYRIRGHLGGKTVVTDFFVIRHSIDSPVEDVFITTL